jgi:hypothetical protein
MADRDSGNSGKGQPLDSSLRDPHMAAIGKLDAWDLQLRPWSVLFTTYEFRHRISSIHSHRALTA